MEKRRDASACVSELAGAFDTFRRVFEAPLAVDGREVAAACEQVVIWAQEQELRETAIEWAEVAAIVDPANARYANLAGRVTRNADEYDRAEVWFKIGLGSARENEDTIELIRAHLGYGTLCKLLGRVRCARNHLNAGANMAWRDGPPSLAAEAQHDLCAMLTVRGHLSEALERAQRALLWYPKTHHRIPFFAADVGLMLVLGRRFTAAARVLRNSLRHVQQPSARGVIMALTARAFAGAGEPEESAVLRRRVFKLLEKHTSLEPVTRWHLADAQRLAGNWDAAQAEAAATLAVAIDHNDREIERLTRYCLRLIDTRRTEPAKAANGHLREFLRNLNERVSGWSPRRGRQWPGPWGADWAA
jgi:tetratricopeptide (TPR) repeat protein